MTTYEKDFNFGILQEESIITKIETFFNDKLTKTEQFCKYDFQGQDTIYEVKSRNIDSQRFYTTILPKDKIIKDKKQIFIFNFTDGIYYIEYKEETFKNIKVMDYQRTTRTGYNDIRKPYYFIPIKLLSKLE